MMMLRQSLRKKRIYHYLSLLALSSISWGIIQSYAVAEQNPIKVGSHIAVTSTQSGQVQGFRRHGIYTYLGIPYATANRFMPPKAIPSWQGIRLAVNRGFTCPQAPIANSGVSDKQENPNQSQFFLDGPRVVESEHCLNLNIWTPSVSDHKKRAVMVWLHGGGFSLGSAYDMNTYDGENLSKKGDVVVVSVNHRLNAMGFLDLSAYGNKYKYSANLGIQDLVAALQWVKNNIEQFGGNPDNVTIFGESGGGAKVLTLMATPAAKGLFHKAIVQSGAVERMGMTLTSPEAGQRVTDLTLQQLNIKPTEIEKLNQIPYQEIIQATLPALQQTAKEQHLLAVLGSGYALDWAPTMDGNYIPQQPVGEKYPAMAKNYTQWSDKEVIQHLKERYGEKTDAVIKAFQAAYPHRALLDLLYVDSFLRTPAMKTARLKAEQKGAPVYQYIFAWSTPVFDSIPMSYHTAEIPFVFHNIDKAENATGGGEAAYALADKMSAAWINFAKTGNPNTKGLPHWSAYTPENGATMIFDNQPEIKHHHDENLMQLLAPNFNF